MEMDDPLSPSRPLILSSYSVSCSLTFNTTPLLSLACPPCLYLVFTTNIHAHTVPSHPPHEFSFTPLTPPPPPSLPPKSSHLCTQVSGLISDGAMWQEEKWTAADESGSVRPLPGGHAAVCQAHSATFSPLSSSLLSACSFPSKSSILTFHVWPAPTLRYGHHDPAFLANRYLVSAGPCQWAGLTKLFTLVEMRTDTREGGNGRGCRRNCQNFAPGSNPQTSKTSHLPLKSQRWHLPAYHLSILSVCGWTVIPLQRTSVKQHCVTFTCSLSGVTMYVILFDLQVPSSIRHIIVLNRTILLHLNLGGLCRLSSSNLI